MNCRQTTCVFVPTTTCNSLLTETRCYLCSLKDCWPQCFDQARVCCCPARWTPGCLVACNNTNNKWQKKKVSEGCWETRKWEKGCMRGLLENGLRTIATYFKKSVCEGARESAYVLRLSYALPPVLAVKTLLSISWGGDLFRWQQRNKDRLRTSVFFTVSHHLFFQPDLVDFQRRAFVAHGHRTEHHFSQHLHVGRTPRTLEAQALLLGFFDFRGARGGAVQRTATAPGGAELAAFPKHFHLALRVLQDKIKNAKFFFKCADMLILLYLYLIVPKSNQLLHVRYVRARYVHTFKFVMSVREASCNHYCHKTIWCIYNLISKMCTGPCPVKFLVGFNCSGKFDTERRSTHVNKPTKPCELHQLLSCAFSTWPRRMFSAWWGVCVCECVCANCSPYNHCLCKRKRRKMKCR